MQITNEQLGCAIHAVLKDKLLVSANDYGQLMSRLIIYLICDNPTGYVNFHESGLSLHQEK